MNDTRVAVDLAQPVFQVAVSTTPGRIDRHHRLSRECIRRFFAQHESADVLMELCGTAHHWGRELEALGHRHSYGGSVGAIAKRIEDGLTPGPWMVPVVPSR